MIVNVLTFFALTILCFQSNNAFPKSETGPLVKTTLGSIRGVKAIDGDYSMFMGIPYAQVNPDNPFGKAIPQKPFDDIFDAIDDSAICPQREEFNNTLVGTLDCMHINIYVPNTSAAGVANPKAVMVMIYGGGFSIGFAGRFLYGPKYLVGLEVILVTFNYRLGPYGFMSLGTAENPGNEGFKDQLLALRWIKENIEGFGGDSDKITVFGNSAGGVSIDYHLLSPQEKLFNQAILQSGTSLMPISTAPEKNAPFILTNYFGFVTNDLSEAIRYLSALDPLMVIEATEVLNLSFGACVEEQFEGVEAFITENWIQASMPKVNKMPLLLGNTNDEGLSTVMATPPADLSDNLVTQYVNAGFNFGSPYFEGMTDLVRRFYVGDDNITFEKSKELTALISDYIFSHPTYRSIDRYLNNDAGDIYFYSFSYVGKRNFARRKNGITIGGATHADELGYLFDISYMNETPTPEDQLFIDRITALWANFAKFGNPTPDITLLLPVQWKPITKSSAYNYLDLGSELTTGARPFFHRMSFWDLFYRANDCLQIIYPENVNGQNNLFSFLKRLL